MYVYDFYKGKDYHIVPTLERIERAVDYLGLKPSYASIQVGGTNGKGSTCAFISNLLQHHDYKVGWFVSPHLFDERERWRINGRKIPEERLSYLIKELKNVFERFELTYFEACTLLALRYFEEEGVDLAVFEVGMGSDGSGAVGFPVATWQYLQALVHTLPNIKKVAVPLEKHSPMLGHRDSSQTVLREYFLKTCCVSNKTSF